MINKIDQSTIDLIKSTRKLYNSKSKDCKQRVVIGWGYYNVRASLPDSVTDQEAEALLIKSLASIEKCILSTINTNLTQNQFNAIASFIYDIGINNFKYSQLPEAINSGNWLSVPNLMRAWNTYLKERIYALTKLRKVEIDLFMS